MMSDQEVRLRIDPKTPLDELMVCTRGIVRSVAGPCREGTIVRNDDARAVLAPEAFTPLIDRIEGLFPPLDERLDR
jgi:hypothetical protein